MRIGKTKIRWQDIVDSPASPDGAEPGDPAIQAHITGTGSPHTAAGVGADPQGMATATILAHTVNHPRPGTRDVRNEAAGTADATVLVHTNNHPAPTTRDARNEAADPALQVHITGTGSPHTADGIGAGHLHGMHSGLTKASLTWDDSSHVLTLTDAHVYYYKGTPVSVLANTTIDLDDFTLANGLWYIYYEDTSGVLTASQSAWSLRETVPVATVFWTGSAGVVNWEGHNSRRDIDWHIHHHTNYGADYYSGLGVTAPNAGSYDTINVGTGTIIDEDIRFNIEAAQTNCRVWYQTAAGVLTFTNSDRAHLWGGSAIQYINSATYAPTDLTGGQRCNTWLYGTTDISRPLQVVVDTLAAPYGTTNAARVATPPNLTAFGLSNEWKLLYRIIWGATSFVEITDYRGDAPKPAGGVDAISATNVSFTPTTEIPYTNVQAALQAVGAIGRSLTFDFDGGGSALTTGAKVILSYLPADFTPTRWSVQCSANDRTGVAASASVAFEITVGNFATDAFPAGVTGGTQPSVTTAVGATAASDFTDVVWSAGQAVMATLTGTPTAKWATLVIEGTVTA